MSARIDGEEAWQSMTELNRNARIAGLAYLLLFGAPLRLLYIPSTLFVKGDAAATMANIAAHETLFRMGIVCDLLTGVFVIFVALALYRLFKGVDQVLAALMVILGAFMVTPIYFMNTLNDAGALMCATGADFLAPFTKEQVDALGLLFLRLHRYGVLVNQIFWGLWLLPMAVLVYRSRFLPRFIGVWLVLNGLTYLSLTAAALLWPAIENTLSNITFPALLGELALVFWLIVFGAKEPTPA